MCVRNLQVLAAQLHPDIDFRIPSSHDQGRAAYLAAAQRMCPLLERVAVHARFHGTDHACGSWRILQ